MDPKGIKRRRGSLSNGQRRAEGAGVVYLAGRRTSGKRRRNTRKSAAPRAGQRRLRMVAAVITLVGLALGVRAGQLSIVDGEKFQALASSQQVESPEAIRRGTIFSADGRQLAVSLDAAKVVATPYQVPDPAKASQQLAGAIGTESGQGASDIQKKLTVRDRKGNLAGYSVLAERVDPRVAQKVKDLRIPGIAVEPDFQRVYPDKRLASQLLGYAGDYGTAYGGVEARYDKLLKENRDLHLTVDTAVQQELDAALYEAVKNYKAKSALGIVMRVKDGSVVALSNIPDYDNNQFTKATANLQRDRALTDPYEPGSTFKAFTISAALEEGAIQKSSVFTVPDTIKVADRTVHDSLPHPVEQMQPAQILQHSSNVGAIQVAQKLGGEKLSGFITKFGFGRKTGIDLWGEDPGDVPPYAKWSGSSIGNIPIGQGLTVTPLQMAAGYATIANGGMSVTPHVVSSEAPPAGQRVISGQTSAIVRGMLQSVVDDGTGKLARIPGYTVAGKTGTSQTVDPKTGTYGDKYIASFIGFAPATNPEYVVLIAVDEPQTSIWGERVAAPAFQKVMQFTLSYYNVPPDRKDTQKNIAPKTGSAP